MSESIVLLFNLVLSLARDMNERVPKKDSVERRGCVIRLLAVGTDESTYEPREWGDIPPERLHQYHANAWQKIRMLVRHPQAFASFEVRDPNATFEYEGTTYQGLWGGGVRGEDYILSVSGFYELVDEAVVLVVLTFAEDLGRNYALSQISHTRNPFFRPLLLQSEAAWRAQQTH